MAHHEKGFYRIQILINDNLGISVLRLRNIRNTKMRGLKGCTTLVKTYISRLFLFVKVMVWNP